VLSVTTNGIISATTVFAGGEDIVGGMGQTNALAVGTVLTGAGFSNNDIIQNSGTALEFVEQGGTAIGTTVNAALHFNREPKPFGRSSDPHGAHMRLRERGLR
jgi:hypothetical protein